MSTNEKTEPRTREDRDWEERTRLINELYRVHDFLREKLVNNEELTMGDAVHLGRVLGACFPELWSNASTRFAPFVNALPVGLDKEKS